MNFLGVPIFSPGGWRNRATPATGSTNSGTSYPEGVSIHNVDTSVTAGYPVVTGGWAVVATFKYDDVSQHTNVFQVLHGLTDGTMFVRTRVGFTDAWTNWRQVAMDGFGGAGGFRPISVTIAAGTATVTVGPGRTQWLYTNNIVQTAEFTITGAVSASTTYYVYLDKDNPTNGIISSVGPRPFESGRILIATFLTNAGNTAATLSDVRSSIDTSQANLAHVPHCRVSRTAALSHTATGNFQVITWDTENQDTDGMWTSGANASRVTINESGIYLCVGSVVFNGNATGDRGIYLKVNGTTIYSGDGGNAGAGVTRKQVSRVLALTKNDYVEVFAFQASGGNLAYFIGDGCPSLEVCAVSQKS